MFERVLICGYGYGVTGYPFPTSVSQVTFTFRWAIFFVASERVTPKVIAPQSQGPPPQGVDAAYFLTRPDAGIVVDLMAITGCFVMYMGSRLESADQ